MDIQGPPALTLWCVIPLDHSRHRGVAAARGLRTPPWKIAPEVKLLIRREISGNRV